jgi:GNAT superfamily N-acetyltransferase
MIEVGIARCDEWAAIRELIIEGLAQRWGTYDTGKNPDLEAFESTYAAHCVVAARSGDRVIGCGALVAESKEAARIVRMSVSSAWQRQGIGRAMVRVLVNKARESQFKEIRVETTTAWHSAVALYLAEGFVLTHTQDGDTHFTFRL